MDQRPPIQGSSDPPVWGVRDTSDASGVASRIRRLSPVTCEAPHAPRRPHPRPLPLSRTHDQRNAHRRRVADQASGGVVRSLFADRRRTGRTGRVDRAQPRKHRRDVRPDHPRPGPTGDRNHAEFPIAVPRRRGHGDDGIPSAHEPPRPGRHLCSGRSGPVPGPPRRIDHSRDARHGESVLPVPLHDGHKFSDHAHARHHVGRGHQRGELDGHLRAIRERSRRVHAGKPEGTTHHPGTR